MPSPTLPVSCRLPIPIYERLKRYADDRGISITRAIIHAILRLPED